MPGTKLSEEIKVFAVQALACFDSPSVAVRSVKEEFGVDVSRQAIESYDPNKRAGAGLSQRYRKIFEETRKAFLADTAQIGVSHRSVRLRMLQRMAAKAEDMRNLPLAAQLLEQVAKEVGNAYTNRRELTGKDGTDLPTAPAVAIYQLPDNGRG